MKLTLVMEHSNWDGSSGKITHEFEADTLTEALEAYQYFLKGCGFHFSGELEIVEDDYYSESDED